MFDLKRLDTRSKSSEGVPMEVLDPRTGRPFLDDDGKKVTITLYGRNSDVFERVDREMKQRAVDRAKYTVGVADAADAIEADLVDYLTELTKTWSGFTVDGADFPPTQENIRAFWSDPRWSWLRKRAETFSLSDGNFLA